MNPSQPIIGPQPPPRGGGDSDSTDEDELSEIQLHDRRKRMQKNIREYIEKYDVEDSPLFATSSKEIEESTVVQAMQAMTYEDPPNEVAENFKEMGNENLQEKQYKNALVNYTNAIDTTLEAREHCALLRKKKPDEINYMKDLDPNLRGEKLQEAIKSRKEAFEQLHEQMEKDPKLGEKLDHVEMLSYNNRAQVHLILCNYRKCIEDSKEVLRYDSSNLKALWRTVKSAYEIRRYKLCKRYCSRAIKILQKESDEKNKKLLPLFKKYVTKCEEQIQKQIVKKRELLMRDRDNRIVNIMQESGISIGKDEIETTQLPPGAKPKKSDRVVLDENSKLIFQVLFVYDEFHQSDFIQAFHEENLLVEHLAQMFPPHGPPFPFGNSEDQKKYVLDNLEVLFYDQESSKQRDVYVRVDMNDKLGSIMRKKEYRLPENLLPIFHIVPSCSQDAHGMDGMDVIRMAHRKLIASQGVGSARVI